MAPTTNDTTTLADLTAVVQRHTKEAEAKVSGDGYPRYCYVENWTGVDLLAHEGEDRSCIWSGHEDVFPDLLSKDEHLHIKYQGGEFPENFKGAVSYVDGRDTQSRKWVFAFDLAAKKVWVNAGPIGPIDWNVVEVKLEASGGSMLYKDPIRKAVMFGSFMHATSYGAFYLEN